MKYVRNIVGIILLMAAVTLIQSCHEYDDITNNVQTDIENYDADMAIIVNSITLSGAPLIDTDLNGYAYVANRQILSDNKISQKGQRIFYTYMTMPQSTGSDGIPYITIIKVNKVLTKALDTLEDSETDTFGQDPINIDGQSISKAHLNLRYTILNGNNNLIAHKISLVATGDAMPDEQGYLNVELRHNAEGDLQLSRNSGYVSFTLESMPGFKEGTLKGFKIKTKTINNGTKFVEIAINSNKKSLDFES